MKDYDAYLFDWDGTLAKTLDLHMSVRRKVLAEHGLHLSDVEIASSLNRLDKALEDWRLDVKVVGGEMDELVGRQLPNVELYPGVVSVLKRLKDAGKKTALITSSWHWWIEDVAERHGLQDYFDVIIGADDVAHIKPHPEPLQKAMKALDVSPERALMLGDSDKDLRAAQNASVDSLLFCPSSHGLFYDLARLQTHRPTYVIGAWQELLDQVQ